MSSPLGGVVGGDGHVFSMSESLSHEEDEEEKSHCSMEFWVLACCVGCLLVSTTQDSFFEANLTGRGMTFFSSLEGSPLAFSARLVRT